MSSSMTTVTGIDSTEIAGTASNEMGDCVPFVVPFWLVREGSKTTANMKRTSMAVVVGKPAREVHVPLMMNTKVLKPGDELLCLPPKDSIEKPAAAKTTCKRKREPN